MTDYAPGVHVEEVQIMTSTVAYDDPITALDILRAITDKKAGTMSMYVGGMGFENDVHYMVIVTTSPIPREFWTNLAVRQYYIGGGDTETHVATVGKLLKAYDHPANKDVENGNPFWVMVYSHDLANVTSVLEEVFHEAPGTTLPGAKAAEVGVDEQTHNKATVHEVERGNMLTYPDVMTNTT